MVILDQAIPPTNIFNIIKFFNKIKVIIVDRDPRDIYVNMAKRKRLLGADLSYADSVTKYVKWHKQLRRVSAEDNAGISKYILRIHFEDLVFKHDESVEKIMKFLGGDMHHNNKGKYFNYKYSSKNVGMWRKYKDQKVMTRISEDLFRQALQRIRSEMNITIVIVAHRLAGIANADQIVVLNQGTVEETGKHNELLKKKGWYTKAWKAQFSNMAENEKI